MAKTRSENIRAILDSVYGVIPSKNKYGGINQGQAEFMISRLFDLKPSRVVEIGTASGISSAIILKALELNGAEYKFHAIEYLDYCYFDHTKTPGFVVEQVYGEHVPDNFFLHLNKNVSDLGNILDGDKVDFIFIDANHSHPWVTLDTICALPFLGHDSTIVYHDINLHLAGGNDKKDDYGAHVLFYNIPATEKIVPGVQVPNIGSLCLSGDPLSYLPSLLNILYGAEWRPNAWPKLDLKNTNKPCEIIERFMGTKGKVQFLEFLKKYLNR